MHIAHLFFFKIRHVEIHISIFWTRTGERQLHVARNGLVKLLHFNSNFSFHLPLMYRYLSYIA